MSSMYLLMVLAIITTPTLSFSHSLPQVQSQYVPIAPLPQGITIPSPSFPSSPPIKIQLIYDPVCQDSRIFDTQIIQPLQSTLPASTLSQIQWRYISQAKPWHLTAHKIVQAINYVKQKQNGTAALRVLRYFMDNNQQWSNKILNNATITQFHIQLAQRVAELTTLNSSQIIKILPHYSVYDGKARVEFKHAIGNRNSGQNPTVFVNGVKVDGAFGLGLEKWREIIMGLGN